MKQTTLGSFIRALRKQAGMTQAQLAGRIGVTDKAVSKWERDLSYPDMALFPKLADLLGVTVNDLLSEAIDVKQPSRLLQIFSMTHDIRTPLHIIIGCANLARLHQEDPRLLERYLESIRVSGEYLLKSVDHLMQMTDQEHDRDRTEQVQFPANVQELGEYLNRRTGAHTDVHAQICFSGKRILVADDIQINREIAAGILGQTGAVLEFAQSGRECAGMVEAAPAGYYDLILMDIMMPDTDGLEATRAIRALADPKKANVPIIALSANVYNKERKAALEAGMNAFAEKPIHIDRLMELLNRYLN